MDYSLQHLNKIINLKNLSLTNFVEKLNLIGLEVDNVTHEKVLTNNFLENIRLLIKIPANRENLLNEVFFIDEISTIFLVEIYETWNLLKSKYFFLLQKKYTEYSYYSIVPISSEQKNIITYLFEIQNCNITTSPSWLLNKLLNFKLTPSNLINDIMNVVFYEWGQNFNRIDASLLSDRNPLDLKLEYLTNLTSYYDIQQKELKTLYPGTVVLKKKNTDEILSVFGLFTSSNQTFSKNEETISFFLESTFYDIHVNSLELNTLRSKISLKHLRRSCLESFKYSFQRLLTLLEILTYCKIISTKYVTKIEKAEVKSTKILRLQRKNLFYFLRINYPDLVIFKKAGLELVCQTKSDYYFKIPMFRQDLTREIDILEEYSRFIGYKNFEEIIPKKQTTYNKKLFEQKTFIKNFFLHHGFNEIITNPFLDSENMNQISVTINNPLNNELFSLRRLILSKLTTIFEINSRLHYSTTNFFEIGRTFKLNNQKIIEQDKLAGIFQLPALNQQKNTSTDWFVAKGFIENFLFHFGYKSITIKKINTKNSFFHPTRTILFCQKNKVLGLFGELHPSLIKEKYSHLRSPAYVFELNMNYLKECKMSSEIISFNEYSKYPVITKDLSFVMDKNINFNLLKSFIFSKSSYLKKVIFFDIYFDETLFNKVNVGIRLEFQSNEKTLTNDLIDIELNKLKELIIKEFAIFTRN